jgi:hypothetical protein
VELLNVDPVDSFLDFLFSLGKALATHLKSAKDKSCQT